MVRAKMPICKDPNYRYLTLGLVAAVVLATSAGSQISLAIAGVLVAVIAFLVTAWFVIEPSVSSSSRVC